jgi:hypothetical protein
MRRYANKASWEEDELLINSDEHTICVSEAQKHRNLGGYINSCQGTGVRAHVEWQRVCNREKDCHYQAEGVNKKVVKYLNFLQGQRTRPRYIMTCAIRPITKGEEIFADYDYMDA